MTPNAIVVLFTLALQNSAHVLLLSYTRQRTGPQYFPSTIVAVGELAKLFVNGVLLLLLEPDPALQLSALRRISFRQLVSYAVPALLYTLGSNVRVWCAASAKRVSKAARGPALCGSMLLGPSGTRRARAATM